MDPWLTPEFLAAASGLVVALTGLVAVILRHGKTSGTAAGSAAPSHVVPDDGKGVK